MRELLGKMCVGLILGFTIIAFGNYSVYADETLNNAQVSLKALPSDNGQIHVDYLIVAPDAFEDELEPLVRWKRKKGYRTEVVTLQRDLGISAIAEYTNYYIQFFLQNAYTNWATPPTYVLLVGDKDLMPPFKMARPLPTPNGPSPTDTYEIITDYPYSLLSGSDPLPDVFLGRLYVSTETQVTNVVNKIVSYEKTTAMTSGWQANTLIAGYLQDHGDPIWLRHPGDDVMANTAANDCEEDWWFFDTTTRIMGFIENTLNKKAYYSYTTDADLKNHCSPYGTTPMRFNSFTYQYQADVYPNALTSQRSGSTIQKDLIDLIDNTDNGTQKIVDAFDNGIGLALYRGHGAPGGWANPLFTTSQLSSLTANNKTPFVLSITCLTGSYETDSFAAKMLQAPNAGAVGVIAASQTSESGYNEHLAHGFITSLWPEYDESYSGDPTAHSAQAGPATAFAKSYAKSKYPANDESALDMFMKFNLFGDPEMMIHTEALVTPRVTWPAAVPEGTTSLSVPCNIDGARVGVSQNNEFLGSAIVRQGRAVITFSKALAPGEVTIVITGRNVKTQERDISTSDQSCSEITATNDQHVAARRALKQQAGCDTFYYTVGANETLGSNNGSLLTTLYSTDGGQSYHVGSCPD